MGFIVHLWRQFSSINRNVDQAAWTDWSFFEWRPATLWIRGIFLGYYLHLTICLWIVLHCSVGFSIPIDFKGSQAPRENRGHGGYWRVGCHKIVKLSSLWILLTCFLRSFCCRVITPCSAIIEAGAELTSAELPPPPADNLPPPPPLNTNELPPPPPGLSCQGLRTGVTVLLYKLHWPTFLVCY